MIFSNDNSIDEHMRGFYRNGDFVKIFVDEIDMNTVSFTYGDSFQQFYNPRTFGEKTYWNKIYTYDEILEIIKEYGWIPKENSIGRGNNPRFIEAQLWSDEQIYKYKHLAP